MRTIKEIFVHCSASDWGDALVIEDWHRRRGFAQIGYHYVILNGHPHRVDDYYSFLDGQIQPGRIISMPGAHVSGRNKESIGICLVGNKTFSDNQLTSLRSLILWHVSRLSLSIDSVFGHYEDGVTSKTCPNMPMDAVREFMKDHISLNTLQQLIKGEITNDASSNYSGDRS